MTIILNLSNGGQKKELPRFFFFRVFRIRIFTNYLRYGIDYNYYFDFTIGSWSILKVCTYFYSY